MHEGEDTTDAAERDKEKSKEDGLARGDDQQTPPPPGGGKPPEGGSGGSGAD